MRHRGVWVFAGAAVGAVLLLVPAAAAGGAGMGEKGWPCWRGPYGSGAAAPSGAELVDDLSKAKLVWKSDQTIPGARVADARRVAPKETALISGGFASPVLADGRVYITYYVPNGDVYDESICKRHVAGGGFGKEKWYVDTDDVIHCFDARTGKTLWKRAFARKGMNFNLFNKGGPCNLTPCVAGGKVYAVGSAGRVYCVDAKAGDPVWQSSVGERAEIMEKLRATCRKQRRIPQFNRDMSSSPVVAGGALVCSDFLGYKVQQPIKQYYWSHQCGMVALDAATGRPLWSIRKSLGNWASPVRWVHKGTEYVVAASGEGKAVCVVPKTGKVLWSADVGKNDYTVCVGEDHLVCNGGTETPQLVCLRITPAGATRAWELPKEYGGTGSSIPVIHKGHVYARCRNGKFVCVELATGKIAGEIAFRRGMGFVVAVDGRILVDADDSHDRDAISMFRAEPARFEKMGGDWSAPNATGYMNPVTPAFGGGRAYMRARDRIHCYDLRKSSRR